MSNQQVGAVYQSVISDVIDSSRVDFEEGGVEEAILEELKTGWQAKLSQLNVASFPWDPKPEAPPAPIVNPPTVPSNAGYSHATPPQQHQSMTQMNPMIQNQNRNQPQNPIQHQNQGQPHIKSEPDDGSGFQQGPIPNGLSAQERAAHLLQNNYGQRAAQSIGKVRESAGPGPQGQLQGQGQPQYQQGPPQHQGQPHHHQGPPQQQQQGHAQHPNQPQFQRGPPNPQLQHPMHMHPQQPQHQQQNSMQQQQRPQQGIQQHQQQQQQQTRPQMTQEQYQAAVAQSQRNQAAQVQASAAQQQAQNASIKSAQTDGAGDDPDVDALSVIKRFDSAGNEIAMGRVEIDNIMRAKIQSMGQTMEGGGLMLALKQASTKSKRERKVVKKNPGGAVGGVDGGDEEDEDAINSDLDDPDDGLNDEEDDDDSMGHIMLCMYDKVQRVKNKWKCVMKDGVLTVNGKEYVFHKASGEYEW